jgi:glutamate---cysteine ligase / carboxylate-amine ligase
VSGEGFHHAFTLGVEEELFLIDPASGQLAPMAATVLERVGLGRDRVDHELFAAELELRTPVLRDAGEVPAALEQSRAAARTAGATLLGAGLHPAAQLWDAQIVPLERYRRVEDEMRDLIRRTPECALHVHVGMPDENTAIRVHNGLRGWLPLLAGLAAASPFWFGRESGLASARSAVVRAYPGRGIPPVLRDMEHWEAVVAEAMASGGLRDYTFLWWDLRLHPRLGTVEVREMDSQGRMDDVAALAALVHGLARIEAEEGGGPYPVREALAWSSFRACRDGVAAEVWHDGAIRPLAEAARSAVERARAGLGDLDGAAALEGIERLVAEGGGAARHRALHRDGGMDGLLARLAAEAA